MHQLRSDPTPISCVTIRIRIVIIRIFDVIIWILNSYDPDLLDCGSGSYAANHAVYAAF